MITFSGGLILGLIIGALVVTALALYIIWAPVRGLRDRCREAEQENERVRQANLDVMMHFEDMKAAKEQAEARTQYLESSIRNAIGWIDGDLRDIIRDVGNQICSYNDLYESADRIEELLVQAIGAKAEEQEKGV